MESNRQIKQKHIVSEAVVQHADWTLDTTNIFYSDHDKTNWDALCTFSISDLYCSSWVKSSYSWQTEEQKLSNRTSTTESNVCHLSQPLNLRVTTPAGGHGMVISILHKSGKII